MKFSTNPQDAANAKIVQRLVSEDEWQALQSALRAALERAERAEQIVRDVGVALGDADAIAAEKKIAELRREIKRLTTIPREHEPIGWPAPSGSAEMPPPPGWRDGDDLSRAR